jgi:SAM-dependent methyltransferase
VVDDPRAYWQIAPHAEDYERGRFANVKGRVYRLVEERAIRRAIRALARRSRVLDAACGTGRIVSLLRREGFAPLGCDISVPMMTVARRTLAEVAFLQSEITCLPFGDGSFDAATCIGLLMHLDRDTRVRALRELARISRRLLVVQYGCVGTFLRVKTRLTGRPAGAVRYPVDEAELRNDVQACGLTEVARFWVLRPFSSSVVLLLAK